MRSWLWMGIILLATPALAAPPHLAPVPNDPLISHWNTPRYSRTEAQQGGLPDYARMETSDKDLSGGQGLSFGPIHAESETISGRRHMRYRVDGLSILGGDIGASIGHHGAMLSLHWPPSGT